MSGKYKLDVTRPDFLLQMMADGDVNKLNEDNMKMGLWDASTLSYVVYTVLMETGPKKSDIVDISNDGESIAVRFSSKSRAKEIKEKCNDRKVRYGSHKFLITTKQRDAYVIFSADEE